MVNEDDGAPEDHRRTHLLVTIGIVLLVAVAFVTIALTAPDVVVEDDVEEFHEVTLTECLAPDADDAQLVRGFAENESSRRSDYQIDVAVLLPDRTRIGTGTADVRDVEPGQRALWTIETDTTEQDWADDAHCEVTGVERTASR